MRLLSLYVNTIKDIKANHLLLFLIRFYQLYISPFKKPSCRFYPTCSCYGYESIRQLGTVPGSLLTIKRVLRCHPLSAGGFDPVPRHFSLKSFFKFSQKKAVAQQELI